MTSLPPNTMPRRRSSRRVTVPFLAAMAAAPLIGCEDQSHSQTDPNTETTAVIDTYESVDQCAAAGFYPRSECEVLYEQAARDYFANVAHFDTKEACEKDSLSCHDRAQFATGGEIKSDQATQQQAQGSSTGSHSHGGSGGVVIVHSGGGYAGSGTSAPSNAGRYAPDYRGFAVARPVNGSTATPVARAVYATPSRELATFSGVRGLAVNESMAASRAAFTGSTTAARGGYGFVSSSTPTSVASRPSFVSSARGGFGASGHSSFGGAHISVGG